MTEYIVQAYGSTIASIEKSSRAASGGALDSSSAGDGLTAREERLASWLTSMEF